ncbi:MAG: hypothetical protein M1518_00440 [Candidatus Thermoplasmatota archaeon]|nr:hypothetical protein [Candidatus Thermoplasmatota archaeon]
MKLRTENVNIEHLSRLIVMQKLGEVDVYHDGETFRVVISYSNGDELVLEGEDLEEILEQLATEMSDKYGKVQRG